MPNFRPPFTFHILPFTNYSAMMLEPGDFILKI